MTNPQDDLTRLRAAARALVDALLADRPKPIAAPLRDLLALLGESAPGKREFSVDYRCGVCKLTGLKLWRLPHGANGEALRCASCLAPSKRVGGDGKFEGSDQVEDEAGEAYWLPAVPVKDTFWGYTSVPDADVAWWKRLPTYVAPLPAWDQSDGAPDVELAETDADGCDCGICQEGRPIAEQTMSLCPTCGNKRCPKGSAHWQECSGSNEPGQAGSFYGPEEHWPKRGDE